jgi:uncharacterized protein HemY
MKRRRFSSERFDVNKNKLGRKTGDTLGTMYTLGRVYRSRRRYKDAEAMLEQVLRVRTRVFGSEHVATLDAMDELAGVYHSQQRHEEAVG